MKKIFAVAVLMLLIAVPANAQLQWGIKGGLNITKPSLDLNVVNKENQTGFFVGPMAEFTVPIIGVGVDAALLYNNKGMKFTEVVSGQEFNQTLQYIDIPINLKYTYGLGSIAGVFVTTGPQFSFNIGGKKLNIDTAKQCTLKSSEFSWNVGLGAKLLGHLQVAYNYNIAVGKTAEVEWTTVGGDIIKKKLKNNSHQISLAYMF
ncbi:MAG: porin family protein [Bacteroidales bacterium]|nr:porin family protein [Bacteroidales bacterium]